MRYRSFQDTFETGDFPFIWEATDSYDRGPYTFVTSQVVREMWDVVDSDFHRRRANGELFNNPKYRNLFAMSHSPYIWETNGDYDCDPSNPVHALKSFSLLEMHELPTLPLLSDNAEIDAELERFDWERDIAVTKAWANVDQSEMLALASMGELPETLRWITSLMQRGLRLIRVFVLRKEKLAFRFIRKPSEWLDLLSDLWMEFRYAFRPLVFEMVQALNALKAAIDKTQRYTARGFYEVKKNDDYTVDGVTCHQMVASFNCKTARHSKYRGGVLYAISSDIDDQLAVWGLDQPLEAIFELTTLSFVVGWFFNVGDVISSWSINPGLKPLLSWISEEHLETLRISLVYASIDPSRSDWACLGNGGEEHQGGTLFVTRTLARRVPSPDKPIMPSLKINLDLAKLLDLAAIGRKMFDVLSRRN